MKVMNKDLHYYMSLPYTIEYRLIDDDDGEGAYYFIQVKELPGCMSQAFTADQIDPMIREAMEGWIDVALEAGIAIPEPTAIPA
jgi:antitoxin HicB